MPLETEYVGREEIGSDSYLGPTRYKITCKCLRCGKNYSRVVSKLTDTDPPCPRKACKSAAEEEEIQRRARNMAQIMEEQRAPGHIGTNVMVKAIDKTAEIVQQDHGLTNLKDNIRIGDTMAPSLPPKLQQAADNFFAGPKGSINPEQKQRRQRQMELLGKRAMAGAYRGMAINPGHVVPGQKGEKGLRYVGTEKLKQ